jgi:hypothetical protein
MLPKERRQVGAHYTSERDILKVVRSLFLDALRAEFGRVKTNKGRLTEFHEKLGRLRFLDPACGCGNFLVVTYRELRLLELEVLKAAYGDQRVIDIRGLSRVDVDAMYGIEINEFPALIAEVAMWLVDHQMNQRVSAAFGMYFVRLPLAKSAMIRHANALRVDWNDVLPARECSFVLGNPPFVGRQFQTSEQAADMKVAAAGVRNAGVLDYVTGWYFLAASYIAGQDIKVGFVSTNSICQGEQVGVLWGELIKRGIRIHFAHRTFAWESEARGKAHVHVVIIGFGEGDASNKLIYDYESDPNNPTVTPAKGISPYLVEGTDSVAIKRSKPINGAPELSFGSMPNDDGGLLLSELEKAQLLSKESRAAKFVRRFMGSTEFINYIPRWCLWLADASPHELRGLPEVMKRIQSVKAARLKSRRATTRMLADTPALFGEIRQPDGPYLAIPKTSSQTRQFIPIGFLGSDVIAGSELFTCPGAGLYHFGILSSTMHAAWVRLVCGRMKSDYRYSARLVYNNFPWPQNPPDKQRLEVEKRAQGVLDARAAYPGSTLADLYDPLTMPAKLSRAHAEQDRAVDLCYRPRAFGTDRIRVEYLFELYDQLTAPLTSTRRKGASATPKRAAKGDPT